MSEAPEFKSRNNEALALVERISDNASDIRGDWSDPRSELRAIQECCDGLRKILGTVSETRPKPDAAKPHWRLADPDPGSDVGVTFEKAYAKDDYDHEPDCHVFSVHVWHGGTDACERFAEELCVLMNKHGVKPPEGWTP